MNATTRTVSDIDRDLQPPLYAKRDVTLVRGEGALLWDSEGVAYLDAMSNYGVNVLGHAHPAVTDAIASQAGLLVSCHQSFTNDVRARFLEALIGVAPDGLTRAFLSNSGTEAIEAGLKFARVASGKTKLVATRGGYHGRTIGALTATAEKKYREPFAKLLGEVTHVRYNDLDALFEAVDAGTAAVVLEPIQGEGGINVPDAGYLAEALKIAHDAGALLVLDEVQTALRTGMIFACERDGITPDILCTAKGLANGVPIGATLITEAISETLGGGVHGSTFGGNPLACAAGLATLQAIQAEGLLAASIARGEQFRGGVEALGSPMVRAIRGVGLMNGVEFRVRVTPILKGLQERGVLALAAGTQVIRFLPPLVIQPDQIDQIVIALGETLESLG
ncbi:MAG TPA: aspartate aminotransferase family protein [Thermomicrobiales bacterium]|nr:aspartate aminotransferase family protein [Thermomicrobiales bacterium]